MPENTTWNELEVGVKAGNLFKLKEQFPVPEFSVISTKEFKNYRKNKRIDEKFAVSLKETLAGFLKKGAVAIRSSGTVEDLPGLSFAGMYSTTLNLTDINSCLQAIVRCWDSIESDRVRAYCQRMKVPMGEMAVIIQHQLKPSVSGVMVTVSPFSVSEVLIECCPGTGERLVSGEIVPSRYRLEKGSIVEQKGEDLLSRDLILELLETGKKIEGIFKTPQDIEWAIEDNKIYILQSRPIMVKASIPRRKGIVWCNANLRETIPDPVSPLMWSLFEGIFFPMIMLDNFKIPITLEQYKKFPPVENLSGRLYWNMNNIIAYGKAIGPIMDMLESNKSIDPQMAEAFKAVDIKNLPIPISRFKFFMFSLVSLFKLTGYTLKSFFIYPSFERMFQARDREVEDLCQRFTVSADPVIGLANAKKLMTQDMKGFFHTYWCGVFLGLCYLIIFQKLMGLCQGKTGEVTARKAMTGLIDKTGEMALAIDRLAVYAEQKMDEPAAEKVKELYETDIDFRERFDNFIAEFGHRGPAEFDIASLNWREAPDMVFSLLTTPRKAKSYVHERREVIEELLKTSGPVVRIILKSFLPRLEAFVPMRECGKHVFLKMFVRVKDQLLSIDKLLNEQGYLTQKRDIFFLTRDEIEGVVRQQIDRADVLRLVEKRKGEQEIYCQTPVPDIIYESGERITAPVEQADVLSGEPLSFGVVRARARVINDFSQSHKLKQGEILITHHADPGWTPLFTIASGVVIEVGGLICHAAMVARELALPAVVIKGATTVIKDGQEIELDADLGRVTKASSNN